MASVPKDMKLVLVGHRGVGKRQLGAKVASRLEIELLDIEHQMEISDVETSYSAEDGRKLTRDYASPVERGFQYRQRMLVEGLRRPGERVIVVPPGCCVASAEAEDEAQIPWVFWVQATGWRYAARRREGEPHRQRAWPNEFEWRMQARRPRWESRADFSFRIPSGRELSKSVELLCDRVEVLGEASRPAGSIRGWIVPSSHFELRRAVRDAGHLGGGVKIRQRMFSEFPDVKKIASDIGKAGHVPRVMASLGGGSVSWLNQPSVTTAEVGAVRAVEVARSGIFSKIDGLDRVWVTGRTNGVDASAVEALGERTRRVRDELAGTGIDVAPRWKPRFGAWTQMRRVLRRTRSIREEWPGADISPVGARWVGMTPWFATRNPAFELSTGLAQWRRSVTQTAEEPSADLQAILPTLAGEPPRSFDAIIGAEVTRDRSAEWHRMAALETNESYGALACDTLPDPDDSSLRAMFDVLLKLGVRGVAVDSPLRRRVLQVDGVRNPEGLSAVNVLTRQSNGWESRDTDHVGMAAVLTEAARRGVEAGPVAIIGRDDRTPAIRRAIAAALDWRVVHHADASGWGWDAPSHVAMVVNLAGAGEGIFERPPSCDLWVDLHDEDIESPPPVAEEHICGDVYFEAQALAARDLWQRGG